MATATEKRQCKGTNKAGKPCKAGPMKASDYCVIHAQDNGEIERVFGGKQPGAGRPRKPREIDVIRESIEANVGAIDRLLQEAEQAERAVVVGNGPSAELIMVPDWPTRIVAARERLDRGYGRPHQSSDITVITEDALTQAIRGWEADAAEREDRAASIASADSTG